MTCSTEPRVCIWIFIFVKNMSKNIGRVLGKNLSRKYSGKLL